MTDTLNDIWQDRRVNIGYETAEELAKCYNRENWRAHPETQRAATEDSLDTLGLIGQIKKSTVNNLMFDGHLRVELALLKNPQMLLPVDYYDLNDDETALALTIHDAITEQAEPIPDKLAALLERTRALTADKPGLAEMLQKLKERAGINGHQKTEDGGPQIDKAAELQKVWGTEVGQIWQLGNHRLAVGDCTDKATVEAVMRGERAEMCLTDPPYNEIDHEWDKELDWLALSENWKITLLDNAHLVLSGKVRFLLVAYEGLRRDWEFRMEEIWRKPQSGSPGHNKRFLQVHENIWWFRRKGNYPLYFDVESVMVKGEPYKRVRKPSSVVNYADGDYTVHSDGWRFPLSVIDCNQPRFSDESVGHPTQKPLEVIERDLLAGTPEGAIVLDPFLGSGTTLIACQNLNRRARAVELDPGYAAVSIQRFYDLTGIEPKLITSEVA